MSATIDERVVEMRFDNKQFESNARESISTLEKLKQALNLSDSAKGLDEIQKAASGVNIGAIGTAIDSVKQKFSVLETIAIGALMRIGQKAVDAGERLVKSLAIDPIQQGFSEYELKMGSIQTIMASTGESLQTVKDYLEELNKYSDMTIYSFSDMTSNIGKFTNAGVKLEDAVLAMKGISNEAAVSGANANEASRAMYNFSQALSAGSVKLIDWKSIQNANMATLEFKQSLMDTAVAMGTLKKEGDKYQSTTVNLQGKTSDLFDASSMFNESLSAQWMTTEVLVQTLSNYATDTRTMTAAEKEAYEEKLRGVGYTEEQIAAIEKLGQKAFDAAQDVKTFSQLMDTLKEAVGSGWAQTFEIIFGDLEEAKQLWTEVSNSVGGFIDQMSTARNELLTGGLSSGWKQFLDLGIPDSDDMIASINTVAKESVSVNKTLVASIDEIIQKTEGLSDAELKAAGYTRSERDEIVQLRQDFHDAKLTTSEFYDKAIEANGGFEKSLKKGWLSSDILKRSVTDLANKTRGLSDEQLAEMGVSREQADSIEALEKSIKDGTISLDEFTGKMTQNSGRENLIDAVRNSCKALIAIIKPIKDAFSEIFPPTTSEQVYQLTENIRKFTEKLVISEETADKIKSTFKGLFAVFDIVKQAINAVIQILLPCVSVAGSFADKILDVTSSIGDWIVAQDEAIKANEFFSKAVSKVNEIITAVTSKFNELVSVVKDFVSTHFKAPDLSFLSEIDIQLETRLNPLKAIFSFFGSAIKTIVNALQKASPIIGTVASAIGKGLSSFGKAITEAFTGGGFNAVMDLFNSGVLATIGLKISSFIGNLSSITKEGKGFVGSILEIKDAVLDTFGAFQEQLKSKVLRNIAVAIGILAASLVVLSLIDSEKMTESLGAITVLFLDLFGSMAAFEKIMSSSGMKSIKSISGSMIILAAAVLILSLAMKKISGIDSDKLLGSLGAVSLLLGEMAAVTVILSKYGGKVKTGAVNIIAFAGAIYILTASVEKLGNLDVDILIKGLVSVGVLLAELAAFMVAAKFGKLKFSQAAGIAVLAGALIILQGVVADFGKMDTSAIIKGLVATGAIMAELAIFTRATGKADQILTTSVAMIGLAAAMKLLAGPMTTFGNMSLEQIGKGLLVMGGALAEVAIAMKLMPKNSATVGLGLIEAAAGIIIMTKALSSMSDMTWDEIARGLTALGISLADMAIALNIMKGTLGGSAAMLVMSVALLAFTPVLKALGGMEWDEIARGLIALAGAFAVIGVAGAVLGPIVPSILGLAGALALLGIAVAAAGVGLLAGAAGLTALATAGVAAAATIVAMLEIIIVGLLNIISDSASALGGAIKTIILTLCDVVVECVPEIVSTILVVVNEVLASLAENIPSIVQNLLQIIIGIIDALAANLPTLIQSVVNLFMSFFAGIVEALKGIDVTVLIEGVLGIGLLAGLMAALSAVAGLAPGAMVGVLAMGAVIAELSLVLAAVGALAQIPGLQWLISEGGSLLQGIGTAIGQFLGGIVGGFMSGVSSQFAQIGTDLSMFMINATPFIVGASMINESTLAGVKALAEAIILLTAGDLISGLTSWLTGGSSLSSFGAELAAFGPYFAQFAADVSGVDPSVVAGSANAAKVLADMATSLPNSGGLAATILGDNSLADFGAQLVAFGPSIAEYSASVAGVNPEVVTASASAAQVMADMASKLPNSGGLAATILGDNTLAGFGEQLMAFGPSIAAYAGSVADVNPAVVVASALAAQVMADMASKLPNSGGMAATILGDNTLASFGEQLAAFGPSIAAYSESVAGINPDVVVASANAAQALSSLATNLPDRGGLFSIFKGDNNIGDFGDSLSKFGDGMAGYYESVSGINTTKLSAVIEETTKLVDLTKNIATIKSSQVSAFSSALKKMGKDGVDEFISAFEDSGSSVSAAVDSMLSNVTASLSGTNSSIISDAQSIGNSIVSSIVTGISDKSNAAASAMRKVVSSIVRELKNGLSNKTLTSIGKSVANGIASGISSGEQSVKTAVGTLCFKVRTAFGNNLLNGSIYDIGSKAAQDLADGITSKIEEIAEQAAQAAKDAIDAAKTKLGEDSPSKVFFEIGKYASVGMANGIAEYASEVSAAGGDVANSAVDPVQTAVATINRMIENGFDDAFNPTITPVLDLSNIEEGAQTVSSLFRGLDVSSTYGKALSANYSFTDRKAGVSGKETEAGKGSTVNHWSLTQNNYSPKALSRADIYRQTRNQFTLLKEAVEAR